MKNKIIAFLLLCAIAVASAASFSACGKAGISKGDKVSAEEWVQAFKKTSNLNNLTYCKQVKTDSKYSGKVYSFPIHNRVESDYNATDKKNYSLTVLYDKTGDRIYQEVNNYEREKSAKKEEGKEQKNINDEEKSIQKYYYLKESANLYYYMSSDKGYYKIDGKRENYDLETKPEMIGNDFDEIKHPFNETYLYYKDENRHFPTEEGRLEELYAKFTYSDGFYTAELCNFTTICTYVTDLITYKVKVSIKDGYVTGIKVNASTTAEIDSSSKACGKYTFKQETIYTVTDIGNTEPSKKFNKNVTEKLTTAKN